MEENIFETPQINEDTSLVNKIRFPDWAKVAIPIFLAFLIGLGLGWQLWGRRAAQPTQDTRMTILLDDDPSLGPKDAPITIVEFGDYQCPYCQIWQENTWPVLQEKYGDQIQLIYRDFPLSSIHSFAIPAAEAANCAHEQGQFWEYHGLLLSNSQGFNETIFEEYAENIGLDLPSFQECLSSRRYQAEVESDFDDGVLLGVQGTPAFFINGFLVSGALPPEAFESIISKIMEN
jgi:protein-disulfide isomerase